MGVEGLFSFRRLVHLFALTSLAESAPVFASSRSPTAATPPRVAFLVLGKGHTTQLLKQRDLIVAPLLDFSVVVDVMVVGSNASKSWQDGIPMYRNLASGIFAADGSGPPEGSIHLGIRLLRITASTASESRASHSGSTALFSTK